MLTGENGKAYELYELLKRRESLWLRIYSKAQNGALPEPL
jgi:hypothetical protein